MSWKHAAFGAERGDRMKFTGDRSEKIGTKDRAAPPKGPMEMTPPTPPVTRNGITTIRGKDGTEINRIQFGDVSRESGEVRIPAVEINHYEK